MENAWLDSLSEDWVSQPRSDGSPAGSLPALTRSTVSAVSRNERAVPSRIPLPASQKQSALKHSDSSALPLSERSANDNNIPRSQRDLGHLSKLRNDLSHGSRGRRFSRTVSASTTNSVQHHTVQYKSLSASPQKLRHAIETPEWKRRLLHGEVAYGEQRDLFSPAGLENIFRPPPPQQIQSPSKLSTRSAEDESIVMPSSPPMFNLGTQAGDDPSSSNIMDHHHDRQATREPRAIKFKLADTGTDPFSNDKPSLRSSSFHEMRSTSGNTSLNALWNQLDENFCVSTHSISLTAIPDRTVSGQSAIRHEDLSPIFISRQSTVDGSIDYVAVDMPTSSLEQRLQEMGLNDTAESSQINPDVLRESFANNTEDFAHNGKFVNLGRGGHAEEGSFQRRMLSSSSLPPIDESGILQEESVQASTPKQLPQIKKTRASDEHDHISARISPPNVPDPQLPTLVKVTNSTVETAPGSPLKLFGTYDTFTNQKLLRRLSQFEDDIPDGAAFGNMQGSQSRPSIMESTNYSELNEAFIAPSSPSKSFRQHQTSSALVKSARLNTFGNGNLDRFEFSEQASLDSNEEDNVEREPNSAVQPTESDSRRSFCFNLYPSPALDGGRVNQKISRFTAVTTKESVATVRNSESVSYGPILDTPRKHYGDNESKRLPHSPLKDPTPKRRRTLHKTDLSNTNLNEHLLDSVRESHQQMQSMISKKRKDARHEDNQQPADPEVMATRQVLRPRNPTLNQRIFRNSGPAVASGTVLSEEEKAVLEQQHEIARIQAELDGSAPPFKNSLGVGPPMYDESRKGSVTTQDFLDEAKKIMAGIRGKARRSELNSVEESDSDNDKKPSTSEAPDDQQLDDSYQESSREPFSRPPSRNGRPVSRLPQKQQDPEVLSHLRKYEEMSEFDGLIASSMKSIGLARDAVNNAQEMDRLANETLSRASNQKLNLEELYQSDPPNIQITENPELQRKRKHSISSNLARSDDQRETEFLSNGSNSSSGQSTGHSIPTGSSRGSESRRVIAAHTVAHLIPEQLAGMIFDREKRIWVKRRAGSDEDESQNVLPSDDDDPFGDIPDLTVDETQELGRMKAVAARKMEEARISEFREHNRSNQEPGKVAVDNQSAVTSSYQEKDNTESLQSSKPSSFSRLVSGATTQSTRLTSWGVCEDPTTRLANSSAQKSTTSETQDEIEEYEEEISIHESRTERHERIPLRNVTISFSSPIASIIEPEDYHIEAAEDVDDAFQDNSVHVTQQRNRKTSSTKSRSSLRTTSQKISLAGHTFIARPISRIEEREEGSFAECIENEHQRSVSIVVSTPLPKRQTSQQVVSITPESVSIMELPPLSDFTINQPDESFGFEVSYIGQRTRRRDSSRNQQVLSLYIKDVVRGITDVEPYEPFWEHIKQMDLRSKRLRSLHMLNKFCGVLENLDVSDNQIGQLDGVPDTIRHLRVTHNLLNDLSSWQHLRNLQYVDVSSNELSNLDSFKDLVHLRGLRADNNKISSLKGIMNLDGLISLRLRNNNVESIDFEGTSLQRLTDLDLKGNSIRSVLNLQDLRSLATLNLEDNELLTFATENRDVLWALKYLKLGGNLLETVDVSRYPNLRLLYLDRNRLVRVNGLLKTKHLDSLSLREQLEGTSIDSSFFNEAFEVRKLFLSGNYLTQFVPTVDFLNLQYLELANCGLESLPIEFGQMMSNIRVLNLNFNALRDIKPLLGIVRLKRLHLSGNRLFRLRKTANVLAQFSHLSKIDLRNNPLTLGFYPPMTEKRIVLQGTGDEENDALIVDHFALEDAEAEKDTPYASRLDMETRMRRRVFEMLMFGGCARLRVLDGLKIDRASLDIRDKVWEGLAKAGLVDSSVQEELVTDGVDKVVQECVTAKADERKDEAAEVMEHEQRQAAPEETAKAEEKSDTVALSQIWGAEDSFA